MFKIIPKIIPPLLFWGVFIFAILQIPYPDSLTQANLTQLLSFFVPLYLAVIFTLNIFLKNILLSSFISLGMIFLLILQALDSLNIVTGVLCLIAVALLVSYFKKTKRHNLTPIKSGLTKLPKIPKIMRINRKSSY